jgi:hypothetical protein
MAGWLSRKP